MIQIILLFLLMLLNNFIGTQATPVPPTETVPADPVAYREALNYGNKVLQEPLWQMTPLEQTQRVRLQWKSDLLGGLAFIDYIYFTGGFTPAELDTFFNKNWFDVSFQNYASWKETRRCSFSRMRVIDFDMVTSFQADYKLRLWLKVVNPDRVLYFFIAFPKGSEAQLEEYARKLFLDGASCENIK